MRFYAQYKENELIAIGIGAGGVEITKEEYEILMSEIKGKNILTEKLYNKEITLSDIPTEWREEIQRRVDKRIAAQEESDKQPISAEEAMNIILGGETE